MCTLICPLYRQPLEYLTGKQINKNGQRKSILTQTHMQIRIYKHHGIYYQQASILSSKERNASVPQSDLIHLKNIKLIYNKRL